MREALCYFINAYFIINLIGCFLVLRNYCRFLFCCGVGIVQCFCNVLSCVTSRTKKLVTLSGIYHIKLFNTRITEIETQITSGN